MDEKTNPPFARQEKKSGFLKNFFSSLKEIIKFAAISLAIVIPFRLWVAQPFIVSGSSMEPSFENGDYLIIDELSYKFKDPQRDDVVVIRIKNSPVFYIKRIIGLPHEKIEIKNNGVYVIQGEKKQELKLNEAFLKGAETYPESSIELKNNEYLVLGDNRTRSLDGRMFGPITKNNITGKVFIRLWPINSIGFAGQK